jgi:hypothetical protein
MAQRRNVGLLMVNVTLTSKSVLECQKRSGEQKLSYRPLKSIVAVPREANPLLSATRRLPLARSGFFTASTVHTMAHAYSSIDGKSRRPSIWIQEVLLVGLLSAIVSSAVTIAVMAAVPLHIRAARIGSTRMLDEPGFATTENLTCGDSIEEAHQHGCTFDPLTVRWLRPECSRHGAQEFVESAGKESYQYWHNKNFTEQFPDYDALSMLAPKVLYWSDQREHLYHCMWLLLRVHHVMEHGGRVDDYTSNYQHSKHCLQMMVDMATTGPHQLDKVAVYGDVGFATC